MMMVIGLMLITFTLLHHNKANGESDCEALNVMEGNIKLHCYCQVVWVPRDEDIHKFDSPYSWFISHISTSDHIIFINSTGAVKLIEAHLNQMAYRDREIIPEGDLFTECLKHIYKDNRARDKLINIHFGSAHTEYHYMASPFTFQNLFSSCMSQLHMLRENILNLQAVAELLSAIEASRRFEQDNPNWLKETFGDATPLALRDNTVKLDALLPVA